MIYSIEINRLQCTKPKEFTIGDLIQLTICFVGYMNKDKTVTMSTVLKALTLIEPMVSNAYRGLREE